MCIQEMIQNSFAYWCFCFHLSINAASSSEVLSLLVSFHSLCVLLPYPRTLPPNQMSCHHQTQCYIILFVLRSSFWFFLIKIHLINLGLDNIVYFLLYNFDVLCKYSPNWSSLLTNRRIGKKKKIEWQQWENTLITLTLFYVSF